MNQQFDQWRWQAADKKLKDTPIVFIAKNVKRADVPIKPALMTMAHFGELGKYKIFLQTKIIYKEELLWKK